MLTRYQYVRSNPLKYVDPSGHKQVCADGDEGGGCGRGANTEQIFRTFDEEHGGRYEGLFAEYYAKLHEATLAVARNDPFVEDYIATALAARNYAANYVPSQAFDPSMYISPDVLLSFAETGVQISKDIMGAFAGGIIIKPKEGSAGGPSANKPFSFKVQYQAYNENPTRTCVYCQRPGTATEVDHAIPRSKGGNATIENAQLTCPHCNQSKGNRSFPLSPPPGYHGPWPPSWYDGPWPPP